MRIRYIHGKYLPAMQGDFPYPGSLRISIDDLGLIEQVKDWGYNTPVFDCGEYLSVGLERFVPADFAAYREIVAEMRAAFAAWVSARCGQ